VKVIDAGVVVDLLTGHLLADVLGEEELAVPHLLDSEVVSVLRKLVLRRELTEEQGSAAIQQFLELSLIRFPAAPFRARMWELRHHVSGYDATYVALAEAIEASELLTTDAKLATVSVALCPITLA
jgi:predicted nucleic acid-binding protein